MICKTSIKVLTLILILTIMFNFTMQPKITYATSAAAVPLAVKYGLPVAEKLIAFLLTCLAAGITYKTLDEAEKAFYNWLDSLPEYEPPQDNGGGGNGWRDSIKQFFKVGAITGAIYGLFNKIMEFYVGIGAKEGENVIEGIEFTDSFVSSEGYIYYKVTDGSIVYPSFVNEKYYLSGGGYRIYRYLRFHFYKSGSDVFVDVLSYADEYDRKGKYVGSPIYRTTSRCFNLGSNFGLTGLGYSIDMTPPPTENQQIHIFKYEEDSSVVPDNGGFVEIPYYVKPDSAVLTDRNPFEEPEWYQPNILDIVPTTTIIDSQGIKKTIYEGTIDDLVNDIINNITFEDIQNSKKREPYTFIQEGTSTVIQTGEESDVPYPSPETGPIDDTAQYQGKVVGLLQSIINWLKHIADIPNKLFEIPDNLDLDFSAFEGADLREKFPWCIPFDLKDSFSAFAQQARNPSFDIDLDTQYFSIHHTIDYSFMTFFIGFFRYACIIFFSIVLISKTRDLIKW